MLNTYINSIAKLSDHLQKHKLLEYIATQFIREYKLIPCIGVEIEFYLSDQINIVEFENRLGISVKKEKGKNQFEIDLAPTTELINYIQQINSIRVNISNIASQLNGHADFRSKPFINDYGNAMHFHISFINTLNYHPHAGMILKLDDSFFTHAARSLCHFMLDSLLIFLPEEEDYLRLNKRFMAPTHVSFGGNNRTVAIRIPDLLPRRLEHRLASSLVDPYIAIFTILKSIYRGLQDPQIIRNIPKIYGNAFDAQYNLTPLPISRKHAQEIFDPSFFLK
ncbi:type I glutamate--ammonia ligase [Candidatus Trichorickettsia mobilis]|uniref:glutamine synthetase n=1 Tax=Candidatus Trichorickettsia mobilis TaxID=1346319 RepID=UPI002B2620E1|nr:glutamine synthetase [Candidatus Trichorickettsia mobilis]